MTTEKCADPSFGVSPYAQAVLHILSTYSPDFAGYLGENGRYTDFDICIQTFTWNNGRERGASLVVFPTLLPTGPCQIFAFGEDRKSDRLFVEEWTQDREPLNGPTVVERRLLLGDDQCTRIYKERVYFSPGDVKNVADHIFKRMAAWNQAWRDA